MVRSRGFLFLLLTLLAAIPLALTPYPTLASHGTTVLITYGSVLVADAHCDQTDAHHCQTNTDSANENMAIGSDPRWVLYESDASNLIAGDTNRTRDIFVRDRDGNQDGHLDHPDDDFNILISKSTAGVQANGRSLFANMSPNGRFIAYWSNATNLVSGVVVPGGAVYQVYLYDADADGDGIYHEPGATTTELVSMGLSGPASSGGSICCPHPTNSGNVLFPSSESNLVAADTNAANDVFFRNRAMGTLTRVSVDAAGVQGNGRSGNIGQGMSWDERFMVFSSRATNLVVGDTNRVEDVFLRDRDPDGDGIFDEPGEVTVTRVTPRGGTNPVISGNGNHVAFVSSDNKLVSGDTGFRDTFVWNRLTAAFTRVSVSTAGAQGDNNVSQYGHAIDYDGSAIAFVSPASTMVSGDTNTGCTTVPGSGNDVFVRDRDTDGNGTYDEAGGVLTERVSASSADVEGCGNGVFLTVGIQAAAAPVIGPAQAGSADDGRWVVFVAASDLLFLDDHNHHSDVMAHDRLSVPVASGPGAAYASALPVSAPMVALVSLVYVLMWAVPRLRRRKA